jgi:predicted metal-dependent enzyme (double-stranded beta helix superfamily)
MVMVRNTLETSIEAIKSVWGPLSTDLVAACRAHLEQLLKTPAAEPWLAALHQEAPANKLLHQDPTHGFVLLAHTEPAGLYRPPHDHGRAWVVYAIQQGDIEMGTYARLEEPDGSVRLVKRGSTRVGPGQVQVYLPGDIHDTRCLTGPALLLRFTERDLKQEDQAAHRVTRYIERDGVWTVRQA